MPQMIIRICLLILLPSFAAATDVLEDFQAYCRCELAEEEETFSRVVASRKDDQSVAAFGQRATLIDDVVIRLLAHLPQVKSGPTNNVGSLKGDGLPVSSDSMDARDILKKYQERFSADLRVPAVSDEELNDLRRYCDARAAMAVDYIARCGGKAVAADEVAPEEAVAISFVLPFLSTCDREWSAGHIEKLPSWMRQESNLDHAEWFALTSGRPLTAYCFAAFREGKGAKKENVTQSYAAYFSKAARKLARIGEFRSGIFCLEEGIRTAEEENNYEDAARMRFELADMYAEMGHPDRAAREMEPITSGEYEEKTWTRSAQLRLTYLFKAARFTDVIEDARKYQRDPRGKTCLPQFYYVEWVAHRRDKNDEDAEQVQEAFISLFPKHPLAANIYFVQAMAYLAKGEYQKARDLLETIEDCDPDSRIMRTARDIREKLDQLENKDEEKRD